MTSVAMNNLWTYIQGLNLSARNRTWLAEKLTEATNAEKAAKQGAPTQMTHEEFLDRVEEARVQYGQGRYYEMLPGENLDDFLNRVG